MTALPVLSTDAYASEINAFAHGEYLGGTRRLPAFTGAVDLTTKPHRYHLYASWTSVASHHLTILRRLLGLEDTLTLSYVDSLRDGRGWAFRGRSGPDPVRGFTLLSEAYEATRPGYAGEVRVPLLWDRSAGAIASDDPAGIIAGVLRTPGAGAALASDPAVDHEVQRLERGFAGALNASAALLDVNRRSTFRQALAELDRRLAVTPYLVSDALSDADVRLWVRLARVDAGANASGRLGPRLDHYHHVWEWALGLYDLPAFRVSTQFHQFAAPFADLPPWNAFSDRQQ